MNEGIVDYIKRNKVTGKMIVIFVLVMVFFTFFSSTINNLMLPRVTLEKPSSGSLIKEISGQGTVLAKSSFEPYIESSLQVKDVMVNAGDSVKKGQQILSLDIENLKSSLQDENARYSQQKIALSRLTDSGSLLTYDNNIEAALENKNVQENNYQCTKTLYDSGFESLDNLKKAEKDKNDAERNYNAAVEAKAKFQRDNQRDIENAQLNLGIQGRKVESLKAQVENDGIYTADADGVITEINFAKGTMANNSKPLYKLSDVSMGYEFKITVDNDLADYVKIGDDVNVNVVSLGSKRAAGKISKITDSEQDRGEKKDIYIDVQADGIMGGESAEAYVSKKTQAYNVLVPNSAVYTDSNGSYILAAKQKDGPLGVENYLQKVSVTVADSDNEKTALTNGIMPNDKIVVQSSKPVSDGDRVVIEQ